jgi:AraC family transcriptional regulator
MTGPHHHGSKPMRQRRIEMIIERRRRAGVATPLSSSARSPWTGFLLERHDLSTGWRAASVHWPAPHVVLVAAGQVSVDFRALTKRHRFVAGSESAVIWPGGYETASHSWSGDGEAVVIELAGPALQWLAQRDDRLAGVALAPQLGISDPVLAAMVHGMAAEVEAGCPGGRLYGESLSLALAAYVSGRFSSNRATAAPPKGGLSRPRLRSVLGYIQSNLGEELSITELAGVAGLGPDHFCRAFRNSVGVPPHQYVIGQRISEAKRLLAARRMSVAEVALTLGFANQSHFTGVFHRVVGTTPKRYQQER